MRNLDRLFQELLDRTLGRSGLPVPRHLALVLDGNRRWARNMGFEDSSVGHAFGRRRVEDVISWCEWVRIPVATLFVASRDNLRKRSPQEIQKLYRIVEEFLGRMLEQKVWEVRVIGCEADLPPAIASRFRELCNATLDSGRKHRLYLAIGYDGQTEILDAANALLASSAQGQPELITEESIEQRLYAGTEYQPELVIRTGSELRMSGFMPWQTTRSEIFFSQVNWPDFTITEFNAALRMYRKRFYLQRLGRRFHDAAGF
ncbi:MAG: di-trans,poly-cis-decaprenylcistransferase [Gemmatimonadetes bacterium]|nr:di-trans,poly-cis-decaprenylcistransferase [Gemmatimonadota bacterium]